jgi:hypothetical protein
MSETKDINYWKQNAEDDYINTPISVLRYITELEKLIQPRLTNEQIDAMWPQRDNQKHAMARFAAKHVRDLLQGKGGEGV